MRRLLWSLAAIVLLAACSTSSSVGTTPGGSGGTGEPPDPSATAVAVGRSSIDGVYHVTITVGDGVAAGLSTRQAGNIDGKVATTFSLGTVRQFITSGVISDGFMGTFVVEGDHVILTDNEGVPLTLGYERKGHALTFTIVEDPAPSPGDAYDAALWTSHPFVGR